MAPGVDAAELIQTLVSLDEETTSHVISSVLEQRPDLAPAVVVRACPDLTYAPARAITERRSTGFVKNFNPHSGYGFIACPDLRDVFGGDVWVHKHQIGSCTEGMEVEFAVMLSKDLKPQAFDIHPVGAPPVQYAGAQAPTQMWYDARYGHPPWADGGKSGWGKGKSMDYSWAAPPSQDWGKGYGGNKGGGKSKIGEAERHPRPEERELLGEFTGMVKSFNYKSELGFGFLECEELKSQGYENDVFVHHSEIRSFSVGDEVLFAAYLNPKGQPQAKDLRPPFGRGDDGMPPSAKRMRSG